MSEPNSNHNLEHNSANELADDLENLVDWDELEKEIIQIRRHFHQNPELSFKEFETANFIKDFMREIGLNFKDQVGGSGIVADLKEDSPDKKTVAVRVDMDALPITEKNNLEYKSKNNGVMHACGHDSHLAIGLGIAKVVASLKNKIEGNIKLVFQPAEEKLQGAEAMLEAGLLEENKIDYIFGFHNWPELPTGQVGLKDGAIMAAVDKFEVELLGKGGHGSEPHKADDPVIMLNNFITQVQTIVSRRLNPLDSAVISIGQIEGGTAFNIIPDQLSLKGTVRTLNEDVREKIFQNLKKILDNLSSEASYNLKYDNLIPPLINNKKVNEFIFETLNTTPGLPKVEYIENPSLVGEDFALFLNEIPGSYFFLGAGVESGKLHDAEYNVNEDILIPGIKTLLGITLNLIR
jgi:amidohydrolase